MHYLLMPGHWKGHMSWEKRKGFVVCKKVPNVLVGQELDNVRNALIDNAWAWLKLEMNIDRATYGAQRAPMPLHVHAAFANRC